MNMLDIGGRLRLAREERGLSQEAVAEAVDLPRTAITQIESGNRRVSTLELTRLAAIFHRQPAYFFEEKKEDPVQALFRMAPGLENHPDIRDQVDRCIELCRDGVSLEILLDKGSRSGPPEYKLPAPGTSWDAVTQGTEVARQERLRLNIGNAPISDISGLIGKQGIWATGMHLPNEMSGLFMCDDSFGLAIIVNASHVRGRKRFSYAHEYAHALMDRDQAVSVSRAENSKELMETRANAFAAAFLMPRGGMHEVLKDLGKGSTVRQEDMIFDAAGGDQIETKSRADSGSQKINYKDVATCAYHFGVSYRAALYRLKSLKHVSKLELPDLIDDEEFGKNYLSELKMDAIEKKEKKSWDSDIRRDIGMLVIEAYQREKISRGRVLEISEKINISGQNLINLANKARGK